MRIVRNKDGYIDLGELESLTDDKTSAIVVSSVSCWNGYRYNVRELSEIAHGHNAYLVLDAAQQAGAVRLDVRHEGVDFLATCGSKWLLGPAGAGFLYVRRELIQGFDPPLPGWRSLPEPEGVQNEDWQPEFPKTAQRFESGLPNFISLSGIKVSLELIHKLGLENIERDILKRTGYILERLLEMGVKVLTPIETEHRAGLVTFLLKKYETLYRELLKHSIITFQHPENVARIYHWPMGGLRVDPTFFNTMDELDEFLRHVKKHV
jgi:selenocysteine lyase/cysteine desulfurase